MTKEAYEDRLREISISMAGYELAAAKAKAAAAEHIAERERLVLEATRHEYSKNKYISVS